MTITLTLNAIRAHRPCEDGWKKLLAHLGKTKADDEPFPLLTVLESNGLADAIWCFRALGPEHRKVLVAFACDCAERALKYASRGDDRPRIAIETMRAWLRGEASLEQVEKAAAWAAEAAEAVAVAEAAAEEAEAAAAAAWAAWAAEAAAGEAAWAKAARTARTAWAAWAEAEAARGDERAWQAERLRELLLAAEAA